MRKDNAHSPKPSQVCRLFLLCVALISHVPTYVLGKDAGRTERRSRMQEPVQQQNQSQDEEPREIRQVKKDHPALKIKAIRNHRKKTWLRDLEIEVTNITNRPIYYIQLSMKFPDIKRDGYPIGEYFRFGNSKLLSFAERPQPDDPFLKPGESYVFKLPEDRWKVMEQVLLYETPESVLKLDLEIQEIRFDDGSGFFNGNTFFRSQPRRVSYYPAAENESGIAGRLTSKSANHTALNKKEILSAFPGKLAAMSVAEEAEGYCWGSHCNYRMKLDGVSCWTKPNGEPCLVQDYFYMSSDSQHPCANPVIDQVVVCWRFSDISEQRCNSYKLEGCGPNEGQIVTGPTSPDATPTPTPSPTPPVCSVGSNPYYVCSSATQRCERVNDCGVSTGTCNAEKYQNSLPCCEAGFVFSTFECSSNGDCLANPAGGVCTQYPCEPPPPSLPGQPPPPKCNGPASGGGGGESGGGGGGYYCTNYWWVETDYLCNADYSSCYLLGSSVTWAGCW